MKTSYSMNIPAAIWRCNQLKACHLSKLQFSSAVISNGDTSWQKYLETLGITSQQGIKLVTEAALLGSAIEHGLSPEMIILSDGARQFAIGIHALCWVHMERSIRRLNGVTAQQRSEIEEVLDQLWVYYRQLKANPRTTDSRTKAAITRALS